MKYLKSIFITLSVFSIFINFTNALDKCAGENVSINYNSSNISSNVCFYASDPTSAFPVPAGIPANANSSVSGFTARVNATITLTCQGLTSNDTLNIVNNRGCCSVGTALAEGRTFWNDSTCVRPVTQPVNTPSQGDFLINTGPGSASIDWGWAFDPDTPAQSVNGHFYMDGPATAANNYANIVASGLCSVSRPDLVQWFIGATPAFNNFGCANHDISSYCDNNVHTVYMYVSNADATSWNLSTTHTFSCAPAANAAIWTRYCTATNDANPNQFWEYSNATPRGYRNTGTTCCSATGIAGACAVPVCTNGATNPPACNAFPPCTNGAINPLTCNQCPSGQYLIAGTCAAAAAASISASTQNAGYTVGQNSTGVNVNYSCTAPSNSYTISRSSPYNANISSGALPPYSGVYSDSIPLTSASQNITYTLSCYLNGALVNQANTSVTVKAKIYVNVTQNPIIPTASNAVIKWVSNGNNCDLRDRPASNLVIANVAKTGTGPYNYTATLTPASPLFRTELNTSGTYGYDIVCGDNTDNSRPLQTAPATVTVYKPTKATALDNNNGSATLTCTADWTNMILRNDDTGLPISGFSFTNTARGVNKTVTYNTLASTPNVTLICSNQYQSDTDSIPKNALTLSGSVIGNIGGAVISKTVGNPVSPATTKEETVNVASSNGYFSNINYEVSGATSQVVEFADTLTGTLSPAGATLRLSSGTETKNINNFGPYLSGAKIKITASKSGITKILNINLESTITPTARIDSISWADDIATVSFTCENATNYSILDPANLANPSLAGGSIPAQYAGSFVYDMLAGEATKNLTLDCSGATKPINLINPTLAAATFQSLMIYPAEQVCGGGEVTIAWKIKDAKGKACKITAENISKNPSAAGTLPAIQSNLATGNVYAYSSLVNKVGPYNSSTVFEDQNRDGVSIGTVSGINVRYSTRFNVTCGGSPTVIPQTSKSVDVKVICRGQE